MFYQVGVNAPISVMIAQALQSANLVTVQVSDHILRILGVH